MDDLDANRTLQHGFIHLLTLLTSELTRTSLRHDTGISILTLCAASVSYPLHLVLTLIREVAVIGEDCVPGT